MIERGKNRPLGEGVLLTVRNAMGRSDTPVSDCLEVGSCAVGRVGVTAGGWTVAAREEEGCEVKPAGTLLGAGAVRPSVLWNRNGFPENMLRETLVKIGGD